MSATDKLGPQWDRHGTSEITHPDAVAQRQRLVVALKGEGAHDFSEHPVQEFHPGDLLSTQRFIWKDQYDSIAGAGSTPPASVVQHRGVNYLTDGHHRQAVARARGETLRAHVMRF